MQRDRHRVRLLAVVMAALTGAGLLAACTGSSSGTSPEKQAAERFLSAFAAGHIATAANLTTSRSTAKAALEASVAGMGTGAKPTLKATAEHTSGHRSTVDFRASWTIPGAASPWRYTGHLPLTLVHGHWRVRWAPADLQPGLSAGTHLLARRVQPSRAALQDSSGKALFARTPVVRVGIEPKLVKNLGKLSKTLAAIPQLDSTASEITRAVKAAANPTDFVDVITLRRPVYQQIRRSIHDLNGTVFQSDTEILTPSAHFGQPLLGSVGEATAQIVTASKGRITAGDETGLGGLQQALNDTLSGTPGVTVVAADEDGSTVKTLDAVADPKPGRPVRLTIDRRTQQAAENALSTVPQAASLVAVQRSTGRILADANTTATTYDYGLAGAFPPGSTFKIATWTAAFTATPSLTASTRVRCPATYTVDGRHFENENKFSYPPIPISAAFGYSCNTSAIKEAMSLPSNAVVSAAKSLGLGAHWSLPVTAFSGTAPVPAGQTEQAADGIGQGRVLASPLLMALIAGAATSGTPVRPALIAGKAVQKGTALPVSIVTKMRTLMRATVNLPGGTGHALAGLPQVLGKTGTAEYGNATPPRSHAWFAGVQGDVAFAVFVYDGASQNVAPAPIVRRFLEGLPQR